MDRHELIVRLNYAIWHLEGHPEQGDITVAWAELNVILNKVRKDVDELVEQEVGA